MPERNTAVMAGHALLCVTAVVLCILPSLVTAETLKVVALYGKYTGFQDHYKQILEDATTYVNDEVSSIVRLPSGDQINVIHENVLRQGRSYDMSLSQATYTVCNKFRSLGASAVILPHDICQDSDLPGVLGNAYTPIIALDPADGSGAIKMRPSMDDLGDMITQAIVHFKWKDFIMLFENDNGMVEYMESQALENNYRVVPIEIEGDFKAQTKDLLKRKIKNILIFVTNEEILKTVVDTAFEEKLLANGYHWIFGNPNPPISKSFLEQKYRHSMAFLTRFKMVANELQYFSTFEKPVRSWSFRERASYDALVLIAGAAALHRQREGSLPEPISHCGSPETSTLMRYLKEVHFRGASGDISFDADGDRVNYTINMFSGKDRFAENQAGYFVQDIHSWEQANGRKWPGKPGKRLYTLPFRQSDARFIQILAVPEPPFIMEHDWEENRFPESRRLINKRQSDTTDTEREPYEGIVWELLKKVKVVMEEELGVDFNFQIRMMNRGQYGQLDLSTGEWDGMIRELIDGDADVAVGALAKNSAREKDIDFTVPWYTSQLKIMILHPSWTFEYPFSLVYPMHITAWFALVVIFVAMCLLVALFAYFSPYEWRQRARRGEATDEEGESFTLHESIFYVLSTSFLQSFRKGPRSWSLRILSAFWFWFVLCIVFIYCSHLSSVFKFSKTAIKIKDVYDLMGQDLIKFGMIRNSPSYDFYRYNKGIYRSVFDRVHNSEENLIEERLEQASYRIRRQWDGRYAILGDERILSYAGDRKPCRLYISGKTLGKIAFSFATPSGSPLRDQLTYAIKLLKKRGEIDKILEMEWSEKLRCAGTSMWEQETKRSFTVHDFQGIYYLMFMGMGGSTIILVLDWLFYVLFHGDGWQTTQGSVEKSKTKKEKKKKKAKPANDYGGSYGALPAETGMSDAQDWL